MTRSKRQVEEEEKNPRTRAGLAHDPKPRRLDDRSRESALGEEVRDGGVGAALRLQRRAADPRGLERPAEMLLAHFLVVAATPRDIHFHHNVTQVPQRHGKNLNGQQEHTNYQAYFPGEPRVFLAASKKLPKKQKF